MKGWTDILLTSSALPLQPGDRLGPYEIVSALGAGGMGEVYRARDTRLGRDVAVKVLPEHLSSAPERLQRFEQEARAAAALNHPNILALFDIGAHEGAPYLVTELLEGATLRDQMTEGQLPIRKALDYAVQLALGMAAAHEKGIIHRDLKPANTFVTGDGRVKILDFGLAKLTEPALLAAGTVTKSTPPFATEPGSVLGTAGYMSPEQVRGGATDHRADIFAFGAMLYEMLSGHRAFEGETSMDAMTAIVRDEPAALPVAERRIPPALVRIVGRCLEKNPSARFQSTRDLAFSLEALSSPSTMSDETAVTPAIAAAPRRERSQSAWGWTAAVGIVAIAIAAVLYRRRAPAAPPRVASFVITTPADLPFQVGLFTSGVAISADGKRLVYRSSQGPLSATSGVLYHRELGQLEATPIHGTEGTLGFFLSPDGNWIGFQSGADNSLKRISVSGGSPQIICALDSLVRGGSWGPDDTIVFATDTTKGLRRVPAAGGEPQVLTRVDPAKGETDHWWPEVLPDGQAVIFTAWNETAERSRIVALSLPSGALSDVVRGGSYPRFSPTGHLVYAVGATLKAVRFGVDTLKAVGDPASVMEGVASTTVGSANYAIAADGSLLYVKGSATPVGQRTLVWVDRQGREEAVNVPPRAYTYARLSPDGTRVALDARDQQNDIWIWDLARETLQRLTNDPGMNRSPVWTPDGTRVAFTAERDGIVESIYWQKADGSGVPERLSVSSVLQIPSSFSHDGTRVVFQSPVSPPYDLGMLNLEEHREDVMVKTAFSELNGAVSPSGRWLVYESNESGESQVYLTGFPDVNASKRQVSTGGGTRPLWSKDGRELFYHQAPDTIMVVPVAPGPDLALGKPGVVVKGPYAVAANNGRHYDVSPDGKRFLLLKNVETAGMKPVAPEIHPVQHWSEELKRLVPAK